jgi:hypothetical protein
LAPSWSYRGCRPYVGHRDDKGYLSVNAAWDHATGELFYLVQPFEKTNSKERIGKTKSRKLKSQFFNMLSLLGSRYPVSHKKQVYLVLDNAPWHRGKDIQAWLEKHPNIHMYFLPSYCPDLNEIERLWKKLRQTKTHNFLAANLAELFQLLTNELHYFTRNPEETILPMIHRRKPKRRAKKRRTPTRRYRKASSQQRVSSKNNKQHRHNEKLKKQPEKP